MNKSGKTIAAAVLLVLAAMPVTGQDELSFKLPEYRVETLDNGITVYLMERHAVPLIYVNMVFDAGSVYDGKAYGLANLTADALLFGAGEKSKSEIEEIVDFHGASLGTGGGSEAAQLSASFAADDAEVFFPLIQDVVMAPAFDETEFNKHLVRMKMQLQRAKESPNAVIGYYVDKFLYRGHPYGNPSVGTIPTLSAISVEDVKEFYSRYYRPEATAIVVAGDFESEAMLADLKERFGGWKVEAEEGNKPILAMESNEFSAPRVLLLDKADAIQTTFVIGGPGVAMSNPDYVAISLVNTILGGRFTSWLNSELRIKSGLTYGARSNFDMRKHGGTFTAASFTATATTGRAMELAFQVLDRLHTEGIDAETLQSGKNYMKGNFPRGYESPGQLARFLATKHIYGLSDEFINGFAANLDAVTPEKVKEVIAQHFPGGNYQIVMAGKADDIREIATGYGEVTEVSILDDEYLSK